MQEYVRVLRGARLVLDHFQQNGRINASSQLHRAVHHIQELIKIFNEVRIENQNQKSTKTQKYDSSSSFNANLSKRKTVPNKWQQDEIDAMSFKVHETIRHDVLTADEDKVLIQDGGIHLNESSNGIGINHQVKNNFNTNVTNDLIGFSTISSEKILTDKDSKSNPMPDNSKSSEQPTTFKSKSMKERAVPSTQIERLFGFGSLAVRMAFGAAAQSISSAATGTKSEISEENAERLAEALCRMRGAALKLGQMLSLQDDSTLPPALVKALDRVKQSADYMPKRQLENQLISQLGNDWRMKFLEFEDVPVAAASIGQVHRAKLLDGSSVVLKIQYPGVAESIESDLNNLKILVDMTGLMPPGLFVDQIIKVAGFELAEECSYTKEAESQMEYRELILNDPILCKHTYVPKVYPELSTNRVLTSEWVEGISIDQAISLTQPVRNAIARTMLISTIRELFTWRLIQSDPNYGNFLYDDSRRMINLIDFGAARKYSKVFVDGYMKLVWAASNRDKDTILEVSKTLGFINGDETAEFINAHVDAGLVVGEPFLSNGPFDFGNSKLTARIGQYGGTFMKYRLTPPPQEAYSLHRKLAGAFLLCIKLKAVIPCRDILEDTYKSYKFD